MPATHEEFWNARPELAAIKQWARARRVAPWAVLGVVLARVITHVPCEVQTPAIVGGPGAINVFVALVARSGGGKGAAIAVGQEALAVNSSLLRVARANLGSGEGISAAFVSREKGENGNTEVVQHTDSVLFEVAEVDTFGAVTSRTGSTLMPEVRKMWSGEALGFQNRDLTRSLPVEAHTYRAAMIVGVQPTRSGALLNDADGGTPQRFLWMPATDPDAPDKAPAPPEALQWTMPGEDILPTSSGRRTMRVCDTAWDAIDSAQIARLRGEGDALDGHSLFSRLKVAAGLALLDQRGEVTEADWQLSGTVMTVSDETRQACRDALRDAARAANEARAEARAEASVVGADHAEITALTRAKQRIIDKLSDQWTSAAPIRSNLSSKLRGYWDQAVADLIECEQIEVVNDQYQNRPRTQFRLISRAVMADSPALPTTPENPRNHADSSPGETVMAESPALPTNRHLSIVDPKEATGS